MTRKGPIPEGCSCHVSPPCQYCVDTAECARCGLRDWGENLSWCDDLGYCDDCMKGINMKRLKLTDAHGRSQYIEADADNAGITIFDALRDGITVEALESLRRMELKVDYGPDSAVLIMYPDGGPDDGERSYLIRCMTHARESIRLLREVYATSMATGGSVMSIPTTEIRELLSRVKPFPGNHRAIDPPEKTEGEDTFVGVMVPPEEAADLEGQARRTEAATRAIVDTEDIP